MTAHGAKFTDPKKVLVQTIPDEMVKDNLIGRSSVMKNKSFVDATGKKGKVRAGIVLYCTGVCLEPL